MYRYIIEDEHHVLPFNEPASSLTIGTQPLKLHQEELFSSVVKRPELKELFKGARERKSELKGVFQDGRELPKVEGQAVVYRDNLWFDIEFLSYFLVVAHRTGRACRAAFAASDRAFSTYVVPLSRGFEKAYDAHGNPIYLLDLWYFPNGYTPDIVPIVIPSDAHEIGFYRVPDYMTLSAVDASTNIKDLTHYAPMRAVISIESWVHIYFATVIFGNFARSGRLDRQIETSFFANLNLLWHALLEQKQLLQASGAVKIGKGCAIDPSAIITGPAEIGDNCSIGAGVMIDNCTIGDNVTIDAGCVLFQSTVANNVFLPFRAALYLTAVMENVIVAQNTCLQMCVIGRNSFVGAGNTFTDFNLVAQKPIKAANRDGELEEIRQIVLGSGIGHNCRIGSGMVIMPGRMIESDVVLIASSQRRVVERSVSFEESDHHHVRGGEAHKRLYPRKDEKVERNEWEDAW